ncbi:uncharacterized protein BP5553_02543 [Venustampulla echinocandica]|uniref:F-box domain-containing protein n=1 Tax=Venustampulla echinocandica TaxID=2656787 RepID=A0A370U462_9HELO|nr:uncharacterized protein BP5553_02543 [Venustampulla echinocandica]RDL42564.1 hypothetical protein BP5553_02543 [Venustampulla echinocandica]
MSFPRFNTLLPELQHEIMRQCNASDLSALAQTCRMMHNEALPFLYRHVDISCHNDPGPHTSQLGGEITADNPTRSYATFGMERQRSFQSRQGMFFEAITKHPEYGRYVEYLTWTYFRFFDKPGQKLIDIQPMWIAFKHLERVKVLDFAAWADETVMSVLDRARAPPLLFPNVQRLRLTGHMPSVFITKLIDSNPAGLVSLECNNLIDSGDEVSYYEDTPRGIGISPLQDDDDDDEFLGFAPAELMSGHLQLLEGRCVKLRHLTIRSLGQDLDETWAEANNPFGSVEKDEARYKEWALFISSVRNTLESLTIEQGTAIDFGDDNYYGRPRLQKTGLPMDDRLLQYVLPIFTQGQWPTLKRLEILGIGSKPRRFVRDFTPRDPNVYAAARKSLADLLEPGGVLVFDSTVRRGFFDGQ